MRRHRDPRVEIRLLLVFKARLFRILSGGATCLKKVAVTDIWLGEGMP